MCLASASNQKKAAKGANSLLMQTQTDVDRMLQGYAGESLEAVERGTGEARGELAYGTQNALAALGQSNTDATRAVNDSLDLATQAINSGVGGLDDYTRTGGAANAMLGNALGLNGAGGNDAATGAFRTSPGYDFRVDQATDAASRKANALGIAGSGNTLSALATLGGNLADQEYGGWLDRLTGLSASGQAGATTQAGLYGALAGLDMQRGSKLADIATGFGQNQATLNSGFGNNLAALSTGLGSSQAGILTNLGGTRGELITNTTAGITGNNLNAAKAADAANNANIQGLLSLGTDLFKTAATGGFGGGKLFG